MHRWINLSFVLLLSLGFTIAALEKSFAVPPDEDDDDSVVPVKVKVLEESLCPGCKEFIQDQLTPVYHTLGATVMTLQIIPFGNARFIASDEDPNKMILECQHGEAECDANSYEQCVALALYPYPQRYLPFLHCLYDVLSPGYSDEKIDRSLVATCAKKSALDWDSIAHCHDDEQFSTAMQWVAYNLTPDHEYVPWVEIDGVHVEMDDDDSLMFAICKAYQARGGTNPHCATVLLSSI